MLDNLFDPNTPGTRHRSSTNNTNLNNGNNNINNNTSLSSVNNNNSNNNTNSSLLPSITTSVIDDVYAASSSSAASENARHRNDVDNAKDPYLVDVDVDVDGVMMDGLDQVEYMNRAGGGSSVNRFYGDGNDDVLLMDDDGDIYNGEQGTRFTTEPISRTLEALALEGLTEF